MLLSAGEGVDVTVFVIRHTYHAEGLFHFLANGGFGHLFELQSESDVVGHVEVGEKGILLKDGIHRTLVWRCLRDVFSGDGDDTFRGGLETGYQAQQSSLAAAGGAQYRYKFALTDREVYIIQYGFVSEVFRYVLYTDDAVRLLHKRY